MFISEFAIIKAFIFVLAKTAAFATVILVGMEVRKAVRNK